MQTRVTRTHCAAWLGHPLSSGGPAWLQSMVQSQQRVDGMAHSLLVLSPRPAVPTLPPYRKPNKGAQGNVRTAGAAAGGEGPAGGHRERAPMLDPRARGGESPRPPTQDRGQQSGAAPGVLHPAESSVGYGSHWFSRRCKTRPSSTPRPVRCHDSALPGPACPPSPCPQHRPILRGPSAWTRALTCGRTSSGDCGSSRGLSAGPSGLWWVGEGLRVRARPHRAFYTPCDPSGLL